MDGSIIVLFCSKYSQQCLSFLNIIRDKLEFRKIYIDNKDIRKTVMDENEKYNIRVVPTVLVFFSNGIMNKYEGEKAFDWANKVRNLIEKDATPPIKKTSLYDSLPTIQELSSNGPQEVLMMEQENSDPSDTKTENLGMKRKIETEPLIKRNQETPKDMYDDENRMDGNRNEKKVFEKKNDSIKLIAQQLQAQREKEDEQLNPNALSKITTPP